MSEKPSKPEYAQQSRLSVVYFRAPVNFGGEEKESVSVPSKADLERGSQPYTPLPRFRRQQPGHRKRR